MTAMTDPLVLALDAFIREHEYWGELDSSVGADCVWMDCTCGGGRSSAERWSLRERSRNHRIARIAMTRATMSARSRATTSSRRMKPTATTASDARKKPSWLCCTLQSLT